MFERPFRRVGSMGALAVVAVCALFLPIVALDAQRAGGAAGGAKPKFKAIWEPVNVPEDLDLQSVFFVSADEGWVAGGNSAAEGGVIYHTKDGGTSWERQLGDPASSDRAYQQIWFANPKLGWATQQSSGPVNLLRTNDGATWLEVGALQPNYNDYRFVSANVGFAVHDADEILRTQDGGRRWQPVYKCAVKAEVEGLTRNVSCLFQKIDFPTPTVGYAMSREVGGGAGFVLAKTTDGGTTWTPSVILPGSNGYEGAIRFEGADAGVLRTNDGRLFHTTDGGATWTGSSGKAALKSEIDFANQNIAWAINYRTMTYTTNGGRSWTSREINFPTLVNAFSLVQPDRGYVVGEHGMVYRYRVVPVDYTSKGMLAAPAM
jgi:photosystem II stability/assembly factor-like uncharacterized protein